MRAFALWWYAASLVILNVNLRNLVAAAGVTDVALYTTQAYVGNVPLAAALGCLMYYVLYLMTGRRRLYLPVAVVYALYLTYLMWFTARAGERHLVISDWQVQFTGDIPATAAENLAFGLLLAAPIVLTVGAYTILAFRIREPNQRYRLSMISAGFLLLFGTILVGYLLRWNEQPWFALAYELPALVASFMALLAYRPPRWVRRRLHLEPAEARPAA